MTTNYCTIIIRKSISYIKMIHSLKVDVIVLILNLHKLILVKHPFDFSAFVYLLFKSFLTLKKVKHYSETKELMLLNCGVGEDT